MSRVILGSTLIGATALYYYRQSISNWGLQLLLKSFESYRSTDKPSITIGETGRFACITYSRMGFTYSLYVPFEKRKVAKLSSIRVYLHKADGPVVDITQQPGIPYLVTASMLGGTHIRVVGENKSVTFESEETVKVEAVLE